MLKTLKEFPSSEQDEFYKQMNKFGSTAGGILRDLYGFTSQEELEAKRKFEAEQAEKRKNFKPLNVPNNVGSFME